MKNELKTKDVFKMMFELNSCFSKEYPNLYVCITFHELQSDMDE